MAADHAALRVLANRSLFVAITAFASGISFLIFQVKQQLICTGDAYRADANAPQDTELWHNAIISGDRETLKALRVLSEAPKLGKRLQRLMFRLPGFALTHTRDLELLDWLDASFPEDIYNNPYNYEEDKQLGAQGHVEIIEWILSHGYCFSGDIVHGAASAGQLELLQYLHATRRKPFGCVTGHVKVAAANGHLDVVRFLLENRPPCIPNDRYDQHDHGSPTAADQAAANGHVEIVQYLRENQREAVHT